MRKIILKIVLGAVTIALGLHIFPTVGSEAAYEPLVQKTPEEHIQHYFGSNASIMLAIFKAESSMNPRNINYNCFYEEEIVDGDTTRTIRKSKSCKPEDRYRAWSVDCGLAQINTKGRECPEELFDVETNIKKAKSIYLEQGLNAWVVYKTGAYKKYL